MGGSDAHQSDSIEAIKNYLLKYVDFSSCRNVLDVGYGGGEWCLGVKELAPHANIKGIDNNPGQVSCLEYIENARFFCVEFERSLDVLLEEKFELIIASSVLQYLDREEAFPVFGKLLSRGGILLCINNHSIAYYLSQFSKSVLKLEFKRCIYYMRPFANYLFNMVKQRHDREVFLTKKHILEHAEKNKLKVDFISNYEAYEKRFLGLPIGLSFIARKMN